MEVDMHNPQPLTLPPLTEDIAIGAIRDFFRDKPFVFFGTGMSCALDNRFGMPALKEHLSGNVVPDDRSSEQVRQWQQVIQSLQNGTDIESALDSVTDSSLLRNITTVTGRFVASIDREYAFQIAKGDVNWPATRFFKRLIDGLPEGDRILQVLTPNYDMLFEYACDSVGIPYTSGFSGGVQRKPDWTAVDYSMRLREQIRQGNHLKAVYKHRKHVRIYKVHGSLNFFFHQNAVVENNSWMWDAPDFSTRIMVTPGLSKYQTLQAYRQELLKWADVAIEKANQFLFLGYGFNDTHLEEYIKRKLVTHGCKGLIITRDSNPRIEALLAEADNLWLVCKTDESGKEDTRIYNNHYSGWLHLPSKRLWDIREFTAQILGD
jgi:hypothetical protein